MKKVLFVLAMIAQMALINTADAQSGGRLNTIIGFNYKAITTAMDTTNVTSSSFVPIYGYVKLDSAGASDTLHVFRENDTLNTKAIAHLTSGAWFNFTGTFVKKLKMKMKTGTGRVTLSVQ